MLRRQPLAVSLGLEIIGTACQSTPKEVWQGRLPASAQATPMTYRLGEQGKQFVVIAAGGHGRLRTKLGDYVVAFALP